MTPEASLLVTLLLSAPYLESPQLTTEPFDLSAAKARSVEKIWVTPELRKLLTALLLPPNDALPQVATDPLDLSAAKAESVEKI